jgi:hypothetical protein
MSSTLADRPTAGAAYLSAFNSMLAAYASLAAIERALDREGIALDGGRFGPTTGEIDLLPFRHSQFGPAVAALRLEDLIQTALAGL